MFGDLNNDNIIDKLLYYIAPTNQLEETELNKVKWFNIWYGVLANIMTGIFDYDNVSKSLKRRIKQSFFCSNYVAGFEFEGVPIVTPVRPMGERNAWNEYTEFSAMLPDGKSLTLKYDDCVIGHNYTITAINDNLMCYHYAEMLAEMEQSVLNSVILSRLTDLIEVENENQVREIIDIIDRRKQGNPFIIAKARPDTESKSTALTSPTEVTKYYDSIRDCLNEFLTVTGLSSLVNPNKKERLIVDEVSSNDDIKNTLLTNRIENMEDFIDEFNKKFNMDIEVSVSDNIYSAVDDLSNINDKGGDDYDD